MTKETYMERNNTNDKTESEYWYPEEVRPYIISYLKKFFPNSIIRQESNLVDILVLENNNATPVEIQRTYLHYGSPVINKFEDDTRRQIENNIDIYNKCWFFLDEKFLNHLKTSTSKSISLNMKWCYVFYKEGKMKMFSINKEGLIKELKNEDIQIFLKFSLSNIDKNKPRIEYNLLKWKKFSTDEMLDIYNKFRQNMDFSHLIQWCRRKGNTSREREYGEICQAHGNLNEINEILNCTYKNISSIKLDARNIGLFNRVGGNSNDRHARINFVDYANIAQYFDGYLKNKELWDYLRNYPIDAHQFYAIIRGNCPNFLKDMKNQRTISEWM